MKIKVIHRLEMDMEDGELNLIIHALQSHAEIGEQKWGMGEARKAAEMRDQIMNVDINYLER